MITAPVCNSCPDKPEFICSKLAMESSKQGVNFIQSQQQTHQNGINGVFINNFEQVSHLVLEFFLYWGRFVTNRGSFSYCKLGQQLF